MDQNELSETIEAGIRELGFARVARASVVDIFSAGQPAAFDIRERLEQFAKDRNLEVREEENFVIFERIKTA